MLRGLLSIAILLASAHAASADDDAARATAVKAMLDAQSKAIVAEDVAAFKATLAPGAVVSFNGDAPEKDIDALRSGDKTYKVVVTSSKIGWAGSWGWVAAEVRITGVMLAAMIEARAKPETKTFHLVELFVADGKQVKARAIELMRTDADTNLVDANDVQELIPLASPSPMIAMLAHPHLSSDPGTSVFGSSESDRGLGGAAAAKLVAGWSKLALEVVDTKNAHDKSLYQTLELAFGDATVAWATLRMKLPGKTRWVPVTAFAIGRKVNGAWELLALEYAPR
jgi:hypothetical protein